MVKVFSQNVRLVSYESKIVKDAKILYLVHNLELLADIDACRLWKHYVISVKLKLQCDPKSIKDVITQPLLNK